MEIMFSMKIKAALLFAAITAVSANAQTVGAEDDT
jgi:hypothetical protein